MDHSEFRDHARCLFHIFIYRLSLPFVIKVLKHAKLMKKLFFSSQESTSIFKQNKYNSSISAVPKRMSPEFYWFTALSSKIMI